MKIEELLMNKLTGEDTYDVILYENRIITEEELKDETVSLCYTKVQFQFLVEQHTCTLTTEEYIRYIENDNYYLPF